MSNAECVKRYQQKQKKRLEDAERKLAAARSVQTWQDAMEEYSDEEGNCPWSSNKLMQDEIDALRATLGAA